LTPPYTPQHNGVSERRNRTLLDMVRSMINLTTLTLSFWDYALDSATRILNMVPTKKVDKTPYELWYGKVPNLSYLKETMGYYFYFPSENKIVVARYAEFFEKNLITQEVSGRDLDLEEIQDEYTSSSEITSEIPMKVQGFEPPCEIALDPDDAFVSKYNNPFSQKSHGDLTCTVVKTILKYLRNTKDMFLVYGGNPDAELRVECYCDAGFETDRDDTKSQTGYVFILNGGAVDWKSSKQSTTTMSATEAEYIAASEAAWKLFDL
ncbi:retrotransposon protein, putative, ty1-copia subclass, partial [Tanacetum coccineum]